MRSLKESWKVVFRRLRQTSGPGGEHLGSLGEDPPELKLVPQIGRRQRKKNARIVDVVTEISF